MDYYYLKDVILGLKKEYDNYSYILNDLKDSISINDKLLVNSEKPVSKYLFDENGIVIGINKKEDSNNKQELKFANDGTIIGF